eukprot:Phypoly_transcript_13192.p1 GENE.Phypoly_transcript_13192~~Phypoly_transcript_13192.p1  ORF type:complete len:319 (+),score=19.64 Phypoly_transcript_13192:97-1053(+)
MAVYWILYCVLLLLNTPVKAACPAWSYDPTLPNGPSHWGDLCPEYAECRDGKTQSPVDLAPAMLIQGQTGNLDYNYQSLLRNITLINTLDTIEGANLGTKNTMSFAGLHTYTLEFFHFHAPSEHRINGVQFPLEMHYLHTDWKGNFATIALLYNSSEGGDGTAGFLQTMALLMQEVPRDNSSIIVPSIDISKQINIANGFYHYEGSSTTPPCFPGVQWFVSSNPIPVDPITLSKFTSFLKNSRPIQDLNGREPSLYVPGTPSSVEKWIFAIGIAGICCLGVLVLLGCARYAYRVYKAKRYENQQELVGFLGSTNNEAL